MLLYFFLLFLFVNADIDCPVVTKSEDRRLDKSKLRLIQYNVEWLFIDYYKTMDCPGNGCTWHNDSQAKLHMSYVLDIVNKLQPDIINFCEIEDCDELNMLSNSSYLPYLKKGTDSATGQNVGFLSKVDPIVDLYRSEEKIAYPLDNNQCGNTTDNGTTDNGTTANGTTGVSKHYITELSINSINIALIGVHLLAMPTDPSRCVQREGQSQVLQNIIFSYIQKDYEIIILGDMNDYDGDILDINSHKPTSRVLEILKGTEGKYKSGYTLLSVASKISKEERFSDWYDSDNNCNTSSINDYSMIDHILITPKLMDIVENVFIYHGYDEYCNKMNSDHYPIVVDFKF